MFLTAVEKISSGLGFSLEKFSYGLQSGHALFFLDLDYFRFTLEYWAVPRECLVNCFAVAASDFGTGALISVVSLVAAPHTRRYFFTVSFHCVPMSNTLLAAHWSFLIFVSFSFCLFSQDFYESWGFFFFENQ